MKLDVTSNVGVIGEVTCIVRNKDGSEIVYPTERNTHTYHWFYTVTGNNTTNAILNPPYTATYLAVGTGTTPITKNSTKLAAPLGTAIGHTSVSAVLTEDIGGVLYRGKEHTWKFQFGTINTTVTEVGIYGNVNASVGLFAGLVLTTPVVVTSEQELYVKYKRMYSGGCAIGYALGNVGSATFFSEIPVAHSGSLVYNDVTYNYSLRCASLYRDSPTSTDMSILKGGQPSAPDYWYTTAAGASPVSSVGTITGSGGIISQTLLTPNTTTRDFNTYRTTFKLPPSAGTFNISNIFFSRASAYGANFALNFDPPLPKTSDNAFEVVIDHTISWSQV